MTWVVVILLVLGAVYMLPLWLERLRRPMDRNQRADAPGKFARLSGGVTHYRWIGPVRGPVAVMVHGLLTSSPMWEDIAKALGDIGYRVLVYDLYNRGYSDAAAGPHDVDLYLRQLDDLLEDQGLTDNLTLVGYSMGGIVATEFAATEPHRMRRLILLAPGGVVMDDSRIARFTRTWPVLGDWLNGVWGPVRLRRQIQADAAAQRKPHVLKARLMELGRRGYFPAVLTCRRGILSHTQERQHRAITRDGIPTITIWGEEDRVIPVSALGMMAQWNRKAHHEEIPGAGHELPYSHTEDVNRLLRRMLRESD